MSKIKIAVVQFAIKKDSFLENIKRAEEFIKKASKSKVSIIVFPENFLSHPANGKKEFIDKKGKAKEEFQKIAKKYKIDIVCGSIIEKEKDRKNYNVSCYIDSSGKIKAKYKKIHLWYPEKTEISQGHKIKVIETKFGKIGLIICWDLAFPEIFRKMVKKGAEIIICPSHWCYGDVGKGIKYDKNSEVKFVDSLCTDRAFEEEIILVYCNTAGKITHKTYTDVSIGHSQITEPFKGTIKKLDHNKEEMFIVEIDTKILKDAEKNYKIKKDLKTKKGFY